MSGRSFQRGTAPAVRPSMWVAISGMIFRVPFSKRQTVAVETSNWRAIAARVSPWVWRYDDKGCRLMLQTYPIGKRAVNSDFTSEVAMSDRRSTKVGDTPAATFLRAWRKHRGLTLQQLADMIGTTPATISRIESGDRDFTGSFLSIVSEALETTPAAILGSDPSDEEVELLLQQVDQKQRRRIFSVVKAMVDNENS
jgi:transcriptional regulator with XRE-family HTH domain